MAENSIPADLILNWDQRGMRMVPVNDWAMTTRSSNRVSVTGLGDKRDTFFSNTVNVHKYHSEANRTNYVELFM